MVEGDTVDAAGATLKFSTSERRILPSGPEPLTCANGIPRSRAIFFAIGVANTRSPFGISDLVSAAGFGCETSAFLEVGAGSASFLDGSLVLGASAWSSFAKESTPERSSPARR